MRSRIRQPAKNNPVQWNADYADGYDKRGCSGIIRVYHGHTIRIISQSEVVDKRLYNIKAAPLSGMCSPVLRR